MPRLYQPSLASNRIDVRQMEPADEAVFRRLYTEVREPELRLTGWPAEEKQRFCDMQYSLQDEHYRRHYADFEPWAICKSGVVTGRLYLATFDGVLILMDITLAASERGKGTGTALLQDILSQADSRQLEMRLHVEPDNPARRLYQRMGFVDIGQAGIYQEMQRFPPAARDGPAIRQHTASAVTPAENGGDEG